MAAMRRVVIIVVVIIIRNLYGAFLEIKFPWSISKFSCTYDLFKNRASWSCLDEFYVFYSNIIYVN